MSKQKISLLTLSILAAGAITEHRFVLADGTVSAAGGDALGVAIADAEDGDYFSADVAGTTTIESGGVFAAGDYLQSDATGRAVLATGTSTRQDAIAGGSAGALVLSGVKATDRLISVLRLNRDATAATIDITDVTAEFTISDDDEIDNAGGTDTTGDSLIVTWETPSPVKARALEASTGAGQFIEALLR